ncbi:hypothetical protein [Streptomyces europaeiscabiei]|uniref:hypothetical protein n=1 Tax=Streptomyces europaeiscabiei TaxID=146819 RepID=UPI0029C042F3|nr:hypothetical protein [Streptomyces europaeiscabiei]
MALGAMDLGEQLKSARCISYLAEFRQNLNAIGPSAAARGLSEEAHEHRLWIAASG